MGNFAALNRLPNYQAGRGSRWPWKCLYGSSGELAGFTSVMVHSANSSTWSEKDDRPQKNGSALVRWLVFTSCHRSGKPAETLPVGTFSWYREHSAKPLFCLGASFFFLFFFAFYLDHSVTYKFITSLPKFKGGINYGYTRTLSSADELPVGTVREAPWGKKETEFSLHFTAETVALSDRFICQVLWADVYANASPPVGWNSHPVTGQN